MLDLKFRISPAAFFQVNTLAAEVLYSTVAEWADLNENTVLLDVCCGTGTIGLTMAKRVKKVIGIEMCKEAVEDAKFNAQLNNISNIEFHCGKAEDVLPRLLKTCDYEDVVAVVDPPRGGLHADVVIALRGSSFVKRLVYVSCAPNGAKNNIVDLTRKPSRRVWGTEFRLMRAVPVDLFPLTPHYELVMLFSRKQNKETGKEKESETAHNSDLQSETSMEDGGKNETGKENNGENEASSKTDIQSETDQGTNLQREHMQTVTSQDIEMNNEIVLEKKQMNQSGQDSDLQSNTSNETDKEKLNCPN